MSDTDDLLDLLSDTNPRMPGWERKVTAAGRAVAQALAERDATIAAAKQARREDGYWNIASFEAILSAAPGDALRAHDAEVWDEGLRAIEEHELNTQQAREGNPYRGAATPSADTLRS